MSRYSILIFDIDIRVAGDNASLSGGYVDRSFVVFGFRLLLAARSNEVVHTGS